MAETQWSGSEPAWHHFVHGEAARGFIHWPAAVGTGKLSVRHAAELSRSMRRLFPRSGSPFAFALLNLSRDETRPPRARTALGILMAAWVNDRRGLRVGPFCHAIASVGRTFDANTLSRAVLGLYRALFPDEESLHEGGDFFRQLVRYGRDPAVGAALVARHLGELSHLPAARAGEAPPRYSVEGTAPPRRIALVHEDDAPFELIAPVLARIGATLCASDVRWTAIWGGQDAGTPDGDGVAVHLVPAREAAMVMVPWLPLEEVPYDEEELAHLLFGARPRVEVPATRRLVSLPPPSSLTRTWTVAEHRSDPTEPLPLLRRKERRAPWIALGLLLGLSVPALGALTLGRSLRVDNLPVARGNLAKTALLLAGAMKPPCPAPEPARPPR